MPLIFEAVFRSINTGMVSCMEKAFGGLQREGAEKDGVACATPLHFNSTNRCQDLLNPVKPRHTIKPPISAGNLHGGQ